MFVNFRGMAYFITSNFNYIDHKDFSIKEINTVVYIMLRAAHDIISYQACATKAS